MLTVGCLVARLVRSVGEHPKLIGIGQMLFYPLLNDEGGSVVTFADVAPLYGPKDWEAFQEEQFEPDYDPD